MMMNETWVMNAIVQELDVEANEVLFEWKSMYNISPTHSVVKLEHIQSLLNPDDGYITVCVGLFPYQFCWQKYWW
jgi:hypothetical protein